MEMALIRWERACSVSTERSTTTTTTTTTAAATPASSVADADECHCKDPTKAPPRPSSPPPPTPTTPPALTIGVELELILPRPPPSLYARLRTALTPLATRLHTAAAPLPHPRPSSIFQLKSDPTITCPPPSAAVEIATPILRGRSWEWVLPRVCAAVATLGPVTVNRTTGLHVHVGVAGRAYTLRELRRLAAAVVLLEAPLDGWHPRHRAPAEALGSCVRSVVGNGALRGLAPAAAVALVLRCGGVRELLGVLNPVAAGGGGGVCRMYKYNFTAVLAHGSVEFRQAAGTARARRVVAWVRCVVGFVQRALATAEEVWRGWAAEGGVPRALWRCFGAPSACGWGRRSRERERGGRGGRRRSGRGSGRVPMRFRLSRRRRSVYLARRGRRGWCM